MGPGRDVTRVAPRSPRAPAGFTLIELIVTLFVVALVAGLAVPAIGRSGETIRARADVSRFAALLRHTREQAITARRPHDVLIDPAGQRVSVKTDAETPRPVLTLPERIAIRANPPEALSVRFEPYGGSSGGDFTLTSSGLRYRVTVDPVTGRVRTERQ